MDYIKTQIQNNVGDVLPTDGKTEGKVLKVIDASGTIGWGDDQKGSDTSGITQDDADKRYVKKEGDTMNGPLTFSKDGDIINLDSRAGKNSFIKDGITRLGFIYDEKRGVCITSEDDHHSKYALFAETDTKQVTIGEGGLKSPKINTDELSLGNDGAKTELSFKGLIVSQNGETKYSITDNGVSIGEHTISKIGSGLSVSANGTLSATGTGGISKDDADKAYVKLPSGGSIGQVLKKGNDNNVIWGDDEKGEAGSGEENQKTFSNVTVGSTTINSTSKTDTLNIAAGTAITLTADATNKKVTIGVDGTVCAMKSDIVTPGNGTITIKQTGKTDQTFTVNQSGPTTINLNDTTYSNATNTKSGLMSSDDKKKLDGMVAGSEVTWTQIEKSGSKIASIMIDGTSTDVYAPTSGGTATDHNNYHTALFSSGLNIATGDSTLSNIFVPQASTSQSGVLKIGTTKDDAAAGDHTHSGYLTSHQSLTDYVNNITTNGTGNVVTNITKSGSTLNITKGNVSSGTTYTHPAHTSYTSGLYKITVDGLGHVSSADKVTKNDITALGIPSSDTNTTYSAGSNLTLTGTTFALANTISVTGTITASGGFYESDRRLKENIASVSDVDKLKSIEFKEFNFKKDEKKRKMYGVIAQELEEVGLENLVNTKEDGTKSVDYVSLLVLAMQEMRDEIKSLKDEIAELKK